MKWTVFFQCSIKTQIGKINCAKDSWHSNIMLLLRYIRFYQIWHECFDSKFILKTLITRKNGQCVSECANLTRCLPIRLNALSTFSRCSSSIILFQYIFTTCLFYRFVWIAFEMHNVLLSSFLIYTLNQVSIGINQRSYHFSIYA